MSFEQFLQKAMLGHTQFEDAQASTSTSRQSANYRQQLVRVMQNHPDWIPIIESDIATMDKHLESNLSNLILFSDAYLSSIPKKRRRVVMPKHEGIIAYNLPAQQAITYLLQRAISSSSLCNTSSVDDILSSVAADKGLQSAYERHLQSVAAACASQRASKQSTKCVE